MIRAVLFDIGNVLVRFGFQRAAAHMAPDSSLDASAIQQVLDRWHPDHESGRIRPDEFVENVMRDIGYRAGAEAFRLAFCDIFTANGPMWEVVRTLKSRGLRLCLFSNTSALHRDWLFRQFPDFALFDDAVFSWEAGCLKPDDGMFRCALDILRLPPEQIAYIDDLAPNTDRGRELGFVTFPYHPDRHPEFLAAARTAGLPV